MSEFPSVEDEKFQATSRVTLVGAVVNLILALGKLLFGFLAQSQALIADGIHSLSDLISDAIVYYAASHAQHGPDVEHPYGHGRFETAGTLGLGILLVLVALGIAWDAVGRLFDTQELLTPGPLALYTALFSILIKEWLYHYTIRVARRIKSDLLRANAWHHRSDAVSSVVVFFGVAGTMAGLDYLDAIAAIAVAVMIARIGWELGLPAFRELVDSGLEEERLEQIRETIHSIGGVRAIHMLRTRRIGGRASVDVHVLVESWLSVSEGHMISQKVMDRLVEQVEEVTDVTVHIDPEDDEISAPCGDLPLRGSAERVLSERWGDSIDAGKRERLLLHYLDGKIDVDVFFPLSVYQDEQQVEGLRRQLQQSLADCTEFRQVRLYFG
ncbi:MAG: cation transporter [Gammaproteobacteria bacterium]|nr:cation transporter [Gammaproteobacteria bacterium]